MMIVEITETPLFYNEMSQTLCLDLLDDNCNIANKIIIKSKINFISLKLNEIIVNEINIYKVISHNVHFSIIYW
jgi:hypothetical protein